MGGRTTSGHGAGAPDEEESPSESEMSVAEKTFPQPGVRYLLIVEGEGGQSTRFVQGEPRDPFGVGTEGAWRIEGRGVLPVHAFVHFDGQSVFMCSTDAGDPVLHEDGHALPRRWTELVAPCRLRMGGVSLTFIIEGRSGQSPAAAWAAYPSAERALADRRVADLGIAERRAREAEAYAREAFARRVIVDPELTQLRERDDAEHTQVDDMMGRQPFDRRITHRRAVEREAGDRRQDNREDVQAGDGELAETRHAPMRWGHVGAGAETPDDVTRIAPDPRLGVGPSARSEASGAHNPLGAPVAARQSGAPLGPRAPVGVFEGASADTRDTAQAPNAEAGAPPERTTPRRVVARGRPSRGIVLALATVAMIAVGLVVVRGKLQSTRNALVVPSAPTLDGAASNTMGSAARPAPSAATRGEPALEAANVDAAVALAEGPTVYPAPRSAERAVAPSDDEPGRKHRADAGAGRTREREAADTLYAGDLRRAAELYEMLAREQPGNPAFARSARILRSRLSSPGSLPR